MGECFRVSELSTCLSALHVNELRSSGPDSVRKRVLSQSLHATFTSRNRSLLVH